MKKIDEFTYNKRFSTFSNWYILEDDYSEKGATVKEKKPYIDDFKKFMEDKIK